PHLRPELESGAAAAVGRAGAAAVFRLRRGLAPALGPEPAARAEVLLRLEAGLVAHLLGARHPVAEIDVGQALLPGPADVVEDQEGAEAAVGMVRLEEGVDHRQP